MINKQHERFLLDQCHADKIRHSGRMLYEHLCGTHALLEAWGNSEPVCTAGLFHSIYGTKKFRHKSWSTAERGTIAKLIGPEAEWLVHVFCIANRPKEWFCQPVISGGVVQLLREIEAANLLEQGSKSSWLQRLRDSDISDGAKRAIEDHLRKADAPVSLRAG